MIRHSKSKKNKVLRRVNNPGREFTGRKNPIVCDRVQKAGKLSGKQVTKTGQRQAGSITDCQAINKRWKVSHHTEDKLALRQAKSTSDWCRLTNKQLVWLINRRRAGEAMRSSKPPVADWQLWQVQIGRQAAGATEQETRYRWSGGRQKDTGGRPAAVTVTC